MVSICQEIDAQIASHIILTAHTLKHPRYGFVVLVVHLITHPLLTLETRATKRVSVLHASHYSLQPDWTFLSSYVESLENRVEKLDKLLRRVRPSFLPLV